VTCCSRRRTYSTTCTQEEITWTLCVVCQIGSPNIGSKPGALNHAPVELHPGLRADSMQLLLSIDFGERCGVGSWARGALGARALGAPMIARQIRALLFVCDSHGSTLRWGLEIAIPILQSLRQCPKVLAELACMRLGQRKIKHRPQKSKRLPFQAVAVIRLVLRMVINSLKNACIIGQSFLCLACFVIPRTLILDANVAHVCVDCFVLAIDGFAITDQPIQHRTEQACACVRHVPDMRRCCINDSPRYLIPT
jgi:hypothetical protein